ncbi:hypothetical protein HYW73_02115 [Candidatus Nomurabacteria bacterium]|nr:hypothetical protein [Candidatus Nomurabacteria bacterium]
MATETKKFIVFPKIQRVKTTTFFERAQKHIFKSVKKNKNLSRDIDKIVYGI